MKTSHHCKLLLLSSIVSSSAFAAGFQINPTASSVARAMGGNGIIGEDIGDMFFNPASLSLFSGEEVFQAGGTYLSVENQFIDQGSFNTINLGGGPVSLPLLGTNRASDDSGVPIGLFYTRAAPWNEEVQLGLSITSPWGLSTTYDSDWLGRYHTISSELRVVDINLAASWKVSDSLLLGVGISGQIADATLEQAIPDVASNSDLLATIEGDDNALGFNAGLIWSPTAELKLGLSYRSKVSHDLEGDRTISAQGTEINKVGALAPLTVPESLHLSMHYSPAGQRWSVAAGIRQTNWSRFEELRVNYADGSSSTVSPQLWEDSYTSGLSFDYRLSPNSKVIGSIGYDESPVPSARLRSAQVPEFDRRVLGFGYEMENPLELCDGCKFYFGYHRVFAKERDIANTNELNAAFSSTLNGYYEKSTVDVFSGHFSITF